MPAGPGSFSTVNAAASSQGALVSPGEIVSIIGNYLGPGTPVPMQIGPDGRVTSLLSGVQVFFNDIPAPLLYVSAGQINAVTPYAIARGSLVTVRVPTPAGQSL